MAGTVGFPRPIRTGTATPLTGRNTRLETMRIWSTSPAGCSNEGPIHHPMNLGPRRSEEHTSELQSRLHLVCRLLLEKKKNKKKHMTNRYRNQDAAGQREISHV